MTAVLWRISDAQPVGPDYLASIVADPNSDAADPSDAAYASTARDHRAPLGLEYLNIWVGQTMAFFRNLNGEAKMSRFDRLWQCIACGQLMQLYQDYANNNLPLVIRTELTPGSNLAFYESQLDQNFTFLGVAYWGKVPQLLPRLYDNPVASDALGFAELRGLRAHRPAAMEAAGTVSARGSADGRAAGVSMAVRS